MTDVRYDDRVMMICITLFALAAVPCDDCSMGKLKEKVDGCSSGRLESGVGPTDDVVDR